MQRRERLINYRDLWREMEELSDEENAVEDQVRARLRFTRLLWAETRHGRTWRSRTEGTTSLYPSAGLGRSTKKRTT
ncbi:hypothetical protein BD414DRAFT_485085 [Trametes punicea]|nr:hypothetical protein BD414DRAFT_485085 [Trametes punicea]